MESIPQQDEQEVSVPAEKVKLKGQLSLPEHSTGIVLFAHGSGSGRHSPRNIYVARTLASAGLATLLFDLLTEDEEKQDSYSGRFRFDVALLGRRLVSGSDWIRSNPATKSLPVGYFGSSTGAAAAIIAATERSDTVGAIVCRGGRVDLAGPALLHVKAPTLLIVGGKDTPVLAINREAMGKIAAEKQLVVVPGASHLFEEPGALAEVAHLAANWFILHLSKAEK